MGPISLFDKSFLQSLSLDESVWFDQFFFPVVCPLFYVETLADLEKSVRQGRTPEKEVGIIADKAPEMSGGPCAYHGDLCVSNLLGMPVPMTGQIPVAHGHPVLTHDGKKGVVFERSPEAEAFSRWQEGAFLSVEREFAKSWRLLLTDLDPLAVPVAIEAMGVDVTKCKSLDRAKEMADKIVSKSDQPLEIVKLLSLFLGLPARLEQEILEKWRFVGFPPLREYAPYAAHVLTVELFYQIAVRAQLISAERPSNRVDIGYLFYLPFCSVFISSDSLHRRCAPLFVRAEQEFVWGEDLKADLRRVNDFYVNLPTQQKEAGIRSFASSPPEFGDFLVAQLWDRHLRPWRGGALKSPVPDPERNRGLVEHITKFSEAPLLSPQEAGFDENEAEAMVIRRLVRKQKGSWWQLPKNLEESGGQKL
jgi:hypothetical protein